MLIGICGGICAGKSSVAAHLIEEHSFRRLFLLARNNTIPSVEQSASGEEVPEDQHRHHEKELSFQSADQLLDFVTLRWRERWVTTDIWDETVLDVLARRPCFLLLSVDAPVSVRWGRFKQRCTLHELEAPDLDQFVLRNDVHLYAPRSGLAPLLSRAQVRLLNPGNSIDAMNLALKALNLHDESRLRPTWDQYFMRLASLAAERSNCMKRRVGCVLVRDKRVISTGYNGTPRGVKNCKDGGCPRCNAAQQAGVGLDTCLCLHAEENALLEAGRERIRDGAILYCDTCPCLTCTVKITQVGITEVVYDTSYSLDPTAAAIFAEGGVKLRQFSPVGDPFFPEAFCSCIAASCWSRRSTTACRPVIGSTYP
ncbi:hypothetical protein K402DRAFT_338280 [Aulographum hederae CBS 113979]|uniref:Deoxycytidylate deaminase n=1 Tax=Aulographum hederae CBS 113979 TaxID=1176131 RepID=A0A6G1GS25_9PEZI|nr:hypothetical protein K402DRAFT_338280 [Aulographum hederae CBS 113979]